MTGPETPTSVTILGEEYRVRGASPELVARLAGFVDAKFRELQTARPAMDLKRLAVMVCMNIAEELYQERSRRDEVVEEALRAVLRCRSSLEGVLETPPGPGSAPR